MARSGRRHGERQRRGSEAKRAKRVDRSGGKLRMRERRKEGRKEEKWKGDRGEGRKEAWLEVQRERACGGPCPEYVLRVSKASGMTRALSQAP